MPQKLEYSSAQYRRARLGDIDWPVFVLVVAQCCVWVNPGEYVRHLPAMGTAQYSFFAVVWRLEFDGFTAVCISVVTAMIATIGAIFPPAHRLNAYRAYFGIVAVLMILRYAGIQYLVYAMGDFFRPMVGVVSWDSWAGHAMLEILIFCPVFLLLLVRLVFPGVQFVGGAKLRRA